MTATAAGALALGLLAIPVLLVLLDVFPQAVASRPSGPGEVARPRSGDYTVLVPIYGSTDYLQNVDYLSPYGGRVVLCTTSGESERFYAELDGLARDHGFRVFRAAYDPGATSGGRQTGGTTRDSVVREALDHVDTAYVVCLDADTVTTSPLFEMVGRLAAEGMELASVRLTVENTDTLLGRLQAHEYRMSMRMRRLMPWLCSGACHLGTTAALRSIMARHSTFFQGNDAELGLLGRSLGFRVGHLDMGVPTWVPADVRSWWRQRFAWAGGEFRLYVVNVRMARRHPWFVLYGALLVFALAPLRLESAVQPSLLLLAVIGVYWATLVVLNRRFLDRALLVYPLYGLVTSLVLVPCGVVSYARMAWSSRNVGLISTRVRRVEA